jgi:DNA polymerase-1
MSTTASTSVAPSPARPTFFIIDGHAQIFRAYFAPFRDLTSPAGQPVKAVYVFTQALLSLIHNQKPAYLIMVIDHGDQTVFRRDLYPAYKANRKERPADFEPQEQLIFQIVRDSGIPMLEAPGFEADDLMATLTHQLDGLGFDTVLVSKDKDLRQLLGPHVRMYDPQGDAFFDEADLLREHGYTPQQAVEIQTLMGDSTDNVPGVAGVGPKTALELIQQFGTADAAVAAAKQEPPVIKKPALREKLAAADEAVKLSRVLVTLRKDVPLPAGHGPFDPAKYQFMGVNHAALSGHLANLGFSSLLKRYGLPTEAVPPPVQAQSIAGDEGSLFATSLFDATPQPVARATVVAPAVAVQQAVPGAATSVGLPYQVINTPEPLAEFIGLLREQKRFGFDTETDSISPVSARLVGMSFSWAAGMGYYVAVAGPLGDRYLDLQTTLDALRPILTDPARQIVGHNIKYDLIVMRRHGIDLPGLAMDTMLAAHLLDSSRTSYGMDSLALKEFGFQKIPTSDLIGRGQQQVTMDTLPVARVGHYAAEDADITHRLDELFAPKLAGQPELQKLADELETPLVSVLAEMEAAGIKVDPTILSTQSQAMGVKIEQLHGQVLEAAGVKFNPDSPKQLADVLFNHLKLPTRKKTKTGFSTDVEVLEELAAMHAVPRLILEYRSLTKLKSTYLDALAGQIEPKTGRIHASFHQIGAATGRLSCSDPNLQNIPIRTDEGRRIRLAFVAEPGHLLLAADYSQIELRVLAHYTREPALMTAFTTGVDIHAVVAAEVFGVPLEAVTREQRSRAKVINFGIIYGITAQGLSRRIDGLGNSEAKVFIEKYKARFPSIDTFMQACVKQASELGYVTTILGRRRHLPDIQSTNFNLRSAAERMAINSVIQGSAADLIKLAMLHISRRLKRENFPARLLLQVHDELVFETPEAQAAALEELVRHEMTVVMGKELSLSVPLGVEVHAAGNWADAK